MFKIKNILFPTDFSKTSLTASEYAVNLAKQYGAKLHVLHVLEKTPPILAIRSLDLSRDKIIKSIDADAQAN
ncbi:MAG: universal stress protein, partial [Ignavibacteriaceae bacterium]|nr:universal stress protein [Ignavibacteriaceae bacterium]